MSESATSAEASSDSGSGRRTLVNWLLALSSLLGAAAVVAYSFLKVMATAACSGQTCPRLGPGEIGYTLIVYGVPAVAVVAVLASFFTARRRRGFVVPLIAWAAIVIAFVVLEVTFPN